MSKGIGCVIELKWIGLMREKKKSRSWSLGIGDGLLFVVGRKSKSGTAAWRAG